MRTNRETYSFVLEEKVIGREEDKRAIIELLLESNVEDNVSVIPIVGLGGLGRQLFLNMCSTIRMSKNILS